MSALEHIGFRLLFWLASHLIDSRLTDKQREDLMHLRNSFSVDGRKVSP